MDHYCENETRKNVSETQVPLNTPESQVICLNYILTGNKKASRLGLMINVRKKKYSSQLWPLISTSLTHWRFSSSIVCKPARRVSQCEKPSRSVVCDVLRSAARLATTTALTTSVPFLPVSDAYYELKEVVTSSTCLKNWLDWLISFSHWL